jgi:predicted ATPase
LTVEDAEERLPAPIFVGRKQELERLDQSLQGALAGAGQVVLVTGEAGSGKTALINEFARRSQATHAELIVATGNCDAQTGAGDPYLPFREVLSLLTADVEFRRASREITREQARRLWTLLPLAIEALVESGPDLLGTYISGEALVSRAAAFTPSPAGWRVRLEELVRRSAATPRDSGLQQSYLFEQYARTLHALARKKPLLLQIEDLHWADSGSCGLLFHLGRRIAHGRILIVGTYRPAEIELDRGGQRHPMTPVINELRRELGELEVHIGEEGTREFIDELLDSEPNDLSEAFRDRLYRQTRAHPLFTVELVRSMREQSMLTQDDAGRWAEGPAMNWETLPARVEGAIGGRIDRLPEHMVTALTLASVQGEEFVAEVVAQVQGSSTRETVALLSGELDKRHRLVTAQGIRRMNGQRISTYRFRHNLFQKYLYGRMDETERAYTHEDVGKALEGLYGERADEIAHQLARHFHEAGVIPKTIGYLRKAAERATRLSANEEAIDHLHRALRIVAEQPETPDRSREELQLQLALGPPLLCTVGPGSEELSRAYMRARELCDQVGNAPQLFQTLFLLVHHHANQGRLPTALELAEQLIQVVESAEEPLPPVIAHWAKGFALIYLGRLTEALDYHERVISLYDPDRDSALAYIFGMDPAVSSLCYGAIALWCLGRIDQAEEYGRRGLTLAREIDHPNSTAHVLLQAAYLGAMRRDAERVQSLADELVALSTEHGVVLFQAWGTIFQGWALSARGRHERAIERLVGGMVAAREAGSQLGHTQVLRFTAESWAQNGDVDKALEFLAEAMEMIEQTDERLHESEILRIRGELLLERNADPTDEAESALRRAIAVARNQGAKLIELRAVISLSRLLRATGRQEEARTMLTALYSTFGEGHDTPDLKQAEALLDELS